MSGLKNLNRGLGLTGIVTGSGNPLDAFGRKSTGLAGYDMGNFVGMGLTDTSGVTASSNSAFANALADGALSPINGMIGLGNGLGLIGQPHLSTGNHTADALI